MCRIIEHTKILSSWKFDEGWIANRKKTNLMQRLYQKVVLTWFSPALLLTWFSQAALLGMISSSKSSSATHLLIMNEDNDLKFNDPSADNEVNDEASADMRITMTHLLIMRITMIAFKANLGWKKVFCIGKHASKHNVREAAYCILGWVKKTKTMHHHHNERWWRRCGNLTEERLRSKQSL